MATIRQFEAGGTTYDIVANELGNSPTIDGLEFTGGGDASRYATCNTAASTTEKTVSVTGLTVATGAVVNVKFLYGNTAAAPTLNVNSTGAKAIMAVGTTAAGNAAWAAGEIVQFVYDGTNWQMVAGAVGSDTVLGRVIVDATPTTGSQNAVQSGGTADIFAALQKQIYNAYPSETLSDQAVAQIDDGADSIPVSALTVNLMAGRSGGGTPSSSNIRPFIPFSSTNYVIIQRCGDNFLQIADGTITASGLTISYSSNGTVSINGTTTQQEFFMTNNLLVNTSTGTSVFKNYIFPTNIAMRGETTASGVRFQFPRYSGTGTTTDILYSNATFTTTNTRTYPYNWGRLVHNATTGTTYNNAVLTPGIYLPSYTGAWKPYRGETVIVPLPAAAGNVYGGVLDPVNGTLTVKYGHIDSYAGESLPGAWLSSKDDYAEGTTPTLGAEVIYELNESDYTTYDLGTTYPFLTEKGTNNIYCNAGTISVTYRADPTLYAAKILMSNQ